VLDSPTRRSMRDRRLNTTRKLGIKSLEAEHSPKAGYSTCRSVSIKHMHIIKAVIDNITCIAYIHEVNYPSTSIHHRHNTCTVLGTLPHTNTIAHYKTKYNLQHGVINI